MKSAVVNVLTTNGKLSAVVQCMQKLSSNITVTRTDIHRSKYW